MSNELWIPSIEVESAHGTREVSLQTRHLMDRTIFLTGGITSDSANCFMEQILFLQKQSPEEINIYINSPGGEVTAGLLIYDLIQACPVPVNLTCTGLAASMAAVLLSSGEKGRRFILPHSKVMIHEPLLSDGVGGSATSIKNISESILDTRDILNRILSKHTGKPLREINRATSFDNYMNAEEAIKFGLCDEIRAGLI